MSGEGIISAASGKGSVLVGEDVWLGLDARSVRADCLKLALVGQEHDSHERVIARANAFAEFVLNGAAR